MNWKVIGDSVAGTGHTTTGKYCEDAMRTGRAVTPGGDVMICCVSDGAGSARFAAEASRMCVDGIVNGLTKAIESGATLDEAIVYAEAEQVLEILNGSAMANEVEIDEYACTLLGCCMGGEAALFFQVGDGAIVRNDGSGHYLPIWWPDNGEYHNTTSFITDDPNFGNLKVLLLNETVDEVALLTDGLQMLALNSESRGAHQPFFADMFRYLRMADSDARIGILQGKLTQYLDSGQINERTDDDKTLVLATRLGA